MPVVEPSLDSPDEVKGGAPSDNDAKSLLPMEPQQNRLRLGRRVGVGLAVLVTLSCVYFAKQPTHDGLEKVGSEAEAYYEIKDEEESVVTDNSCPGCCQRNTKDWASKCEWTGASCPCHVCSECLPGNCGTDGKRPCGVEDFLFLTKGWNEAEFSGKQAGNEQYCETLKDTYQCKGAECDYYVMTPDTIQGCKEFESDGKGGKTCVPGQEVGTWPPGKQGELFSYDPRVFGPGVWKSLHTMAENYKSPPSEAAVAACTNFIRALPYMIPCPHCGWHFGEFIEKNDNLSGRYDETCMGAIGSTSSGAVYSESMCLSVSEACLSQRSLVSFFVRAHNSVSYNVHPCRAKFSIKEGYRKYSTSLKKFVAKDTVWGRNQICGGGFSLYVKANNNITCAPSSNTDCDQTPGPSGSGKNPNDSEQQYYGAFENCSTNTAKACGTVACN